nr:putative ubiquitin-conjugating enzyme E2 38 [Tanacetum cinerariifolium]
MDLLRVAIIGAKGIPYHDGFFFDVYFEIFTRMHKQTTKEEDEGNKETSTIKFRKDVASCSKLLVTAFKWTEAGEPEELPPPSSKQTIFCLTSSRKYLFQHTKSGPLSYLMFGYFYPAICSLYALTQQFYTLLEAFNSDDASNASNQGYK